MGSLFSEKACTGININEYLGKKKGSMKFTIQYLIFGQFSDLRHSRQPLHLQLNTSWSKLLTRSILPRFHESLGINSKSMANRALTSTTSYHQHHQTWIQSYPVPILQNNTCNVESWFCIGVIVCPLPLLINSMLLTIIICLINMIKAAAGGKEMKSSHHPHNWIYQQHRECSTTRPQKGTA